MIKLYSSKDFNFKICLFTCKPFGGREGKWEKILEEREELGDMVAGSGVLIPKNI